jgi:cyclin-dependent kinase 10
VAFGLTDKARDKQTNRLVALKKIRLEPDSGEQSQDANKKHNEGVIPLDGIPLAHLREILLLRNLRHPNIILVEDVVVGKMLDSIFTVMEFCTQDVAALLDTMNKKFTPSETKCLMWQLLKGVEYLHSVCVIHRDLKLSNLLLAEDGTLKIGMC